MNHNKPCIFPKKGRKFVGVVKQSRTASKHSSYIFVDTLAYLCYTYGKRKWLRSRHNESGPKPPGLSSHVPHFSHSHLLGRKPISCYQVTLLELDICCSSHHVESWPLMGQIRLTQAGLTEKDINDATIFTLS